MYVAGLIEIPGVGAPRLVPLYAHRFLLAGRDAFGHPVMSVWGLDIICYSHDLADYIDHDFGERHEDAPWNPQATVPFWKASRFGVRPGRVES
ncbi:hypothetical protein ACIBG6_12485 [Streptomyces sp. NPDC050842]|uniref:hypothetical protein n=1 Tax=Streptomyces sp. NPDC050842 TaxID=3365636 RepID=UPI0037BAECA7